jgi:predicted ribosomally synthesized peptide with SipW-like signal peptide
MSLRKFANLGGVGLAGLALIGAGAAATFTQSTTSNHPVQAGTMNVTLSGAGTLSDSGRTLTFATFGPTNSSFTTGDQAVTITNNGNIPVLEIVATIGATGDTALLGQLYVCEVSSGQVIYNGPLSAAGAQAINGTLTAYPGPGNTDGYSINVYAGNVTTGCGAATTPGAPAVSGPSTAPSLLNSAQGQSATVSLTVDYSG